MGAAPATNGFPEPAREACPDCGHPVLVAVVHEQVVLADPWEWEPRARCYVCATIENSGKKRSNCDRCGGVGYVGRERPQTMTLGIDVAWSDTGHVRLVGPRTKRMPGEALYPLHLHEQSVIVAESQPLLIGAVA